MSFVTGSLTFIIDILDSMKKNLLTKEYIFSLLYDIIIILNTRGCSYSYYDRKAWQLIERVLFYSREQQFTEWTCLHVHLANCR